MDHTIEAHFVVSADAGLGAPKTEAEQREDRIVAAMVQAMGGPDHGNFNAIRLEVAARQIYRAVTAMNAALFRE